MLKMNIENPLTGLVSGFLRVKIGVKCSKLTNLKSVKKRCCFSGTLLYEKRKAEYIPKPGVME